MICVVQRVDRASVEVGGKVVGEIGNGLLVLAGFGLDDAPRDLEVMASKIAGLRVFPDESGRMNLDVAQVRGSVLAVSQFTLLADMRKGRRPSFQEAAAPETAASLMDQFIGQLRWLGLPVETGQFQAHMFVESVNNGPVTLILDSRTWRSKAP